MLNTQGNLFEQPSDEPAPEPRPADQARLELSPEGAEKRRLEKEARQRRTTQEAAKRQERIDRAAEQGVDLRSHAEIQREASKRGVQKAREALNPE